MSCFVTIATKDEPWASLVEVLRDSLVKHSRYPLVVRHPAEFSLPNVRHREWFAKWPAVVDALKDHETVVYLDADCVATGRVDDLMADASMCIGYPLFPVHPNHPFKESPENYLGLSRAVNVKCGPYVHAATFCANRTCTQWFADATRLTNALTAKGFDLPVGDETVANLMLWTLPMFGTLSIIDPFWKHPTPDACVLHGCKDPVEARKLI